MKIGLTSRWIWIQRTLIVSQAVAGLFLTLTSIAAKSDVTKCAIWIRPAVEWLQSVGVAVVVICSIWLWAAQWLKAMMGDAVTSELVKFLLEELRSDVFSINANPVANRDRVTLFKFRSYRLRCCCFPVFDWLCAIERTGHMRGSRRWFRVNEDGQGEHGVEGIAGKAYVEGVLVLADNLPAIEKNSPLEVKKLYADKTFVPLKWVEKRAGRLAQSLCGIPVEVKGQVWGVIVIDSAGCSLGKREKIERFYQKNAKILSKLLEKL